MNKWKNKKITIQVTGWYVNIRGTQGREIKYKKFLILNDLENLQNKKNNAAFKKYFSIYRGVFWIYTNSICFVRSKEQKTIADQILC